MMRHLIIVERQDNLFQRPNPPAGLFDKLRDAVSSSASMGVPLASKLPDVGTTIFTVMSQLSLDCEAINLSQGFPSFDPPESLIERIEHYLRSGAN